MNRKPGFLLPICLMIGACAAALPRAPGALDPAQLTMRYEARSLTDPALRAAILAQAPSEAWALAHDRWDLTSLTLAAYRLQPALAAARAAYGLSKATVSTAGTPPAYGATIGPTYSPNPVEGTPWAIGLALDVPIVTAGKIGKQVAAATDLARAAALDLGRVAWQVRTRVRDALATDLLAEDSEALLGREVALRQADAKVIGERFTVGEVSRPVLDSARITLIEAQARLRAAKGQAASDRAALATAVGIPAAGLDGATLLWPGFEHPETTMPLSRARLVYAGLADRLDVRAAVARYQSSMDALQLAVARRWPDLRLGPGFEYNPGANAYTLDLSFAIPQVQGPIAEAEARRQQAGIALLVLQARTVGQIDQALARYQAAIGELEQADRILAPLQGTDLEAYRRQFAAGETGRLTLLGEELQAMTAEQARLSALQSAQQALGALEGVVERPLDASFLSPSPALPETTR